MSLIQKICLVVLILFPVLGLSQDTLRSRIDTTICVSVDLDYFFAPYDTSSYDFEWYSLPNNSLLSNNDSLFILDFDSVLLVSKPIDETLDVLVDSIYTSLRITPIVKLDIPSVDCYNGDSLMLKDNSTLFGDYTNVSYSSSDGNNLFAIDSLVKVLVGNGDSLEITATYIIEECSIEIDTVIKVKTHLQPTANFTSMTVCENEFLSVENLSSDTSNANYVFEIGNTQFNFQSSNPFVLSDTIPDGAYSLLGVIENDNGCIDSSSLITIDIDSVTYVSFDFLEDEYCELQDTSVLDSNQSSGSYVGQFITDFGNGQASFIPTMSGENIDVTFSYTNLNGCIDQETQIVSTVHAKPQLELSGLLDEYCQGEMASIISLIDDGLQVTSLFEWTKDGSFFDSQLSLDYEFDPLEPGIYSVLSTYTDANECFDSLTTLTKVNPLPNVELDSLSVLIPGQSISIGNISGAEPDVEYVWSNGSDMSFIDVDLPGIYLLTGTNDITGCEASDTARIEFDASIETELIGIHIAPNPIMDQVIITLSTSVQNIRIVDVFGEVVSLNGSSIFNTDANDELTLDMSNQSSGYYYILIPNIGNFLLLKI